MSASIIIVSYNVAGFITFCIDSILRSEDIDSYEIIVIDNCSTDHSIEVIRTRYPNITLIANDVNVGFSKACNQGAHLAKGEVVVFLNPDCIVGEDVLKRLVSKSLELNVGLVGPLLVDGSGHILPESAREMPSTLSGLTKLLGLPLQKEYPYYKKITDEIELIAPVLCGACICVSKEKFNIFGGFDERFFMYGEDIDLSVMSIEQGYTNFCLTDTTVLHFKGESTNKGELINNYNFYDAIRLYVAKHNISKSNHSMEKVGAGLLVSSLTKASYLGYRLKNVAAVITDFILIILIFIIFQFLWSYIKSATWYYFGTVQYLFHYVVYAVIWIAVLHLQGAYFISKSSKSKIFRSGIIGGLIILMIYSLLPESMRFSRMILVLSILTVPIILELRHFGIAPKFDRSYVISHRRKEDAEEINKDAELVHFNDHLEFIKSGDKVIFDFNSVPSSKVISIIRSLSVLKPDYQFWDSRSKFFFSSNNKGTMGVSSLSLRYYRIAEPSSLMQKRTLDLIVMMVLYVPLLLSSRFNFDLLNKVLKGEYTIVGYDVSELAGASLPLISPSLIHCYPSQVKEEEKKMIAVDYALNYTIFDDVYVILTRLMFLLKVMEKK